MILLVGSSSLFALFITILCFSQTIQNELTKRNQLKWVRGETKYLDDELEKSFYQRFILPGWKKLLAALAKLTSRAPKGSAKSKERDSRLENELRLAGVHLSVQEFMFLRIIVTIGLLLLAGFFVLTLEVEAKVKFLIGIFALLLVVLIPRYFLKSRIKHRRAAVQVQMPNVMDVFCVSIEAGLSFDSTLLKVMERFKGPLIEELSQVYREIQMGKPRHEALFSLNQRSNVEELQTFASAVIQSEQFGTPIKNVLRVQAQQLRTNRRQQAQEKGMKAPVKMTLPMVFFIFPVIFIILLGPTIINVIT